jgi:putative glycosyltransferase (TIGR04372 family)
MTARAGAVALLRPAFRALGAVVHALLRALEPWRRVRIGYLENERIGHQAINTEMFLRSRVVDPPDAPCLDLLVSGPPANAQLDAMLRRRARVLRLPLLGALHHEGLKARLAGTRFEADLDLYHYDFQRCRTAPPQLAFTPAEEERGRALLESLGVPAGAPFVCFHARSAAYLAAKHVPGEAGWSYHDFRDCSLENYLPAANRLAELGYHVLRMGSVVDRPLPPAHPRVVDYATRGRGDFGDVYLSARARFFIGNTAGLVCVPWIFDVPVLLTNMVPLFFPRAHTPRDVVVPKRLWDRAQGRALTFREMAAASWHEGPLYERAGLEVRENSAEEILEAAEEMHARLAGSWTPGPQDEELQRRFQDLVPAEVRARGCPYRLSAGFLRRHRGLLGEPLFIP